MQKTVGQGVARPDIIFVETPVLETGPLAKRFPKGSGIVVLTSGSRRPVSWSDDFYAAADPEMNFEATKVLFAAQQTRGDRWQIWEMDRDGANKRQITNCVEDCVRGAYLSANEIAFTVEQSHDSRKESYIAVAKTDGTQLRRITFGPADFALETVLRDGRIVASAPWPLNGVQERGSRTLYTLRPDGTALESFRCDHNQSTWRAEAAELSDGTLVFIDRPRKEMAPGGELMRTVRGSATATPLGKSEAMWESPWELSEKELVASKATTASSGSGTKFDLYAVNARTGKAGECIFADAQLSSVQAVPMVPREFPKHFWSTLNPESSTGYFISLNSYRSADAPGGRFEQPIANVRVLTVNGMADHDRVLGDAPVESDGSFYVQVPANTPVRFILLDSKGQVVREEHSWVWTRPGEQRGCTGCHGDKRVAPENHWPMTLKRFDTPIALGETKNGSATPAAK